MRSSFSLQQFDHSDIPGLISLSASVGWDYDAEEIKTVMAAGKVYGHRNVEGKIVSSAAIIPYDDSLASIGMVIVRDECRGMGLGRMVTQACIEAVYPETTIMLIATEQGKPLYERLGFRSISCVHKYLCDRYVPANSQRSAEVEFIPYREEHFPHVVQLDRNAVGADRSSFLKHRIAQAKECYLVKDQRGTMVGYGLSVEGPVNLILGPIAAPTVEIATHLLDKLAFQHQGKLRIDVPGGNEEFLPLLMKRGFQKASQPPVMIRNAKQLPARNGALYGIAAQVFG